jgi:hypothetical protein
MSLNEEQRTENMTFFLDGISWLSLMMDLALLIGIAVFQVGLCLFFFLWSNAKRFSYRDCSNISSTAILCTGSNDILITLLVSFFTSACHNLVTSHFVLTS